MTINNEGPQSNTDEGSCTLIAFENSQDFMTVNGKGLLIFRQTG